MAMSKKILASLLAAAFALSAPMTAAAAWQKDASGIWSWTENGTKATGWRSIGGKWYYFDTRGNMKTGWQKVNGTWYYLNQSGDMATGWKQLNGTWYYLNQSGDMATGWQKVNGTWYYLNQSGDMATGWKMVNDTWYHLQNWGGMTTGWLQSSGNWYYLDSWGAMAANWRHIGNTWYYMDPSGVMQTGFFTAGGKTYFANGSGAMQSGVVQIDGETYYFGDSGDGSMKTGTVSIDGQTYVFDDDGTAVGRAPQADVAYTTSENGSISATTPERVPSGGGSGGSGGGSTTTPEEPTIEEKVEAVLQAAVKYEYEDGYTPAGTAAIDGTEITYTYTPDDLAGSGAGTNPIVADLARFLGAIYRSDEESEGAQIVYGEAVYTWDEDKGLAGSNWVDAEGRTLVSAITADLAEAVLAGKEASLSFTYRGVEITATAKVDTSITVTTEEQLKAALGNAAYTEIIFGDDIELSDTVEITRKVAIDGKRHTLSAPGKGNVLRVVQADSVSLKNLTVAGDSEGEVGAPSWQGHYAIQVYDSQGVTLENVSANSSDAGLLVNGAAVTLKGAIDVSGNEYGGIEVSQGSGLAEQGVLNVSGAALKNSSESAANPTIWIDVNAEGALGGTVNGAEALTRVDNTGNGNKQTYFFLNEENQPGYEEPDGDGDEETAPAIAMDSTATVSKAERLFATDGTGLVSDFNPGDLTSVSASLKKGSKDYNAVLLKVSVTSGNADNLQLIAQDTSGNYYDVVKAGQWGPSGGFVLADATTNFYIVSDAADSYTVQVDLVDVSSSDTVLATATATLTVTEE